MPANIVRLFGCACLAAAIIIKAPAVMGSEVSTWSTNADENNKHAPDGWTTGTMLPNQVSPTAREMMASIKRWYDTVPIPGVDLVGLGADPTGSADSAAACQAAIDSVSAGTAVRIVFQHGTYKLNSDCTSNGRYVTADLTSGALVGVNYGGSGTGALFVTRSERMAGRQNFVEMQGDDSSSGVLGQAWSISNNTTAESDVGAFQFKYSGDGVPPDNSADIAEWHLSGWPGLVGNNKRHSIWGAWDVTVSPLANATDVAAGLAIGGWAREVNPVSNFPDWGVWTEFDSSQSGAAVGIPTNWMGGIVIQPDIWVPGGGFGGHGQLAYACSNSIVANNRVASPTVPHSPASATGGYVAKWYACFQALNNSTAPNGRTYYAGGDTTSTTALFPYTPFEARHNYLHGIRLDNMTSFGNDALLMSATQTINWTDSNVANPTTLAFIGYSAGAASLTTSVPLLVIGGLTATTVRVTQSSPASGDACSAGLIAADTNFLYTCSASGVWKRVAMTGGY